MFTKGLIICKPDPTIKLTMDGQNLQFKEHEIIPLLQEIGG